MTFERLYRMLGCCIFISCISCSPIRAQAPQFLPEINAHLKLNSALQTYLQLKDDRDGGEPDQFAIGPSVRLSLKPLVKLKKITEFHLDDSKSRLLVLETGYRYITAPGSPPKNRMLVAATANFAALAGFHLSDRSRFDLDWKSGGFAWRYRNKLTLQRTFSIFSYHLIPYVAAEPYYTSSFSKWSTTDLFAGCLLPVGKHVEFNPYYEHENDTGGSKNKQQNYFGIALHLYFSVAKH